MLKLDYLIIINFGIVNNQNQVSDYQTGVFFHSWFFSANSIARLESFQYSSMCHLYFFNRVILWYKILKSNDILSTFVIDLYDSRCQPSGTHFNNYVCVDNTPAKSPRWPTKIATCGDGVHWLDLKWFTHTALKSYKY